MNALTLGIVSTLGVVVLFGSRRWALLAIAAGVLSLTLGQSIEVMGLAMYPVRVLEVLTLVRIVARGELFEQRFNRLDRAVVALHVFTALVFAIRSDEGVLYQIGAAVDALLLYAGFRSLIRDVEDLRWLLRALVLLLLPYTALVWLESQSFENPFAAVGGVQLIRAGDLWIREGRLRATGSFGHPSLLGTLGGSFLPLYIGLWLSQPPQRRALAVAGALLCLGIVGASNSGGPVTCVAVAVVGWLVWPFRRTMGIVRIGLLTAFMGLALVMKAPVWYLIARISDVTGGGGFHRAVLLDIGFQNLQRWWFAGMPMRETAGWLPYNNLFTGAVDMTNNFLAFGLTAGLGAMLLLVMLVTVAYSQLGRALAVVRSGSEEAQGVEPLFWALGVTLTVHVLNWFGVTYWDQTNVLWFMHLALIGSGTAAILAEDEQRLHGEAVPDAPVSASGQV
jgi:hypothetical protein